MNVVSVPRELRPIINDHRLMLEEECFKHFTSTNIETDRWYLPIMWTTLYQRYSRRLDIPYNQIQSFLDTLDKSKKYFTVTIYDDGILNNISDLDIKVFSANSNNNTYIPVPLTYTFRPVVHSFKKRKYKVCYLGHETHPIRKKIVDLYSNKQNWYIKNGFDGYTFHDQLMADSDFALCPRGYGVNSYRIAEALCYGAIPIYISDEFHEPFNVPLTKYGLRIPFDQIDVIETVINNFSKEEIDSKRRKNSDIFSEYFEIRKCIYRILELV